MEGGVDIEYSLMNSLYLSKDIKSRSHCASSTLALRHNSMNIQR